MRRRIVPAATAATLIVVGLTGCSGASNAAAACEAPLATGALTESVTVTGGEGGVPEVEIDSDATILTTQRTIVEAAEDRSVVASDGAIVAANLAYFDSVTGELLEATPTFGTGEGGELFLATAEGGPIIEGVMCAAPGDLVAIGISPELSLGAVSTPGASLVALAEVVDVYPGQVRGAVRALPSGFPSVTTDTDGNVGIVLPPQTAPSETRSAIRIQGEGDTVQAGSTVIGNVLTVSWDGAQIKNTYGTSPENLGTEEQMAQSGVSFRSELTGLPVGSQVVVIEPGDGSPRVSVIDILAIA